MRKLFLVVLCGIWAATGYAADLSVNCDAGGDLQVAIGAAADGDTLIVRGECVGNFVIDSTTTQPGTHVLAIRSFSRNRAILNANGMATNGNGTVLTVGKSIDLMLQDITGKPDVC